ncbi:amidohydrolase [Streptomyces sp. NPDC054796]
MPQATAGLFPTVAGGPYALVDQHNFGVLHEELGLGTFETHLAAAVGGAAPRSGTFFDSRLGFALRRWCPPLLGLEPHCSPARYLARRRELGAFAAGRTLLRGSGIGCFLVDTATPPDPVPAPAPVPACTPDRHGLTSPDELAAAASATAREVVCLETLAAQVADTSGSVRSFVANTAEALHSAAREAVAFTCDAGFHEARAPVLAEVQRAATRWLRARAERQNGARRHGPHARPADYGDYGDYEGHGAYGNRTGGTDRSRSRPAVAAVPPPRAGGPARDGECGTAHHALRSEPALVRHLLWSALVTGRPVRLRCGDPTPLEGFLRASSGLGTEVVLLARRPHHRAAARLAAAFPHTYADAGPRPAETLYEAPFGKLLFSSEARALPELYVVRARAFAGELERLLGEWVGEGFCTRTDAARIARQLAGGTARRVYGLDGADGPDVAAG